MSARTLIDACHRASYREGNHGARPMPRHLLSIASIVCLVVCVALIGMWVRSYKSLDDLTVRFTHSHFIACISMPGRLLFDEAFLISDDSWNWTLYSMPIDDSMEVPGGPRFWTSLGFGANTSSTNSLVMLPYWCLVLISGSLAMLCQLRWPLRFTLRNLFIATTFLAVVLGMIAWLDRASIGK